MNRRRTLFFAALLAAPHPALFAGDQLESLAEKIGDRIEKKPAPALAVLQFPYSRNRFSSGSHLISERLVTYLVRHGNVVIERRLLDKLLQERKLWETGLIDPSSIRKAGRVLGVDAIVTGFLTDLSETATEVLVRVVKVDTGEVIASVSGVIERAWRDPPRLPRAAQPRSAMPISAIPSTAFDADPSEPVRARPRDGERRRYYPAPVPFVLPNASGSTQRRSLP